uniref:Uncharacterized protein n=1 Tax=Physcomitrium patens TaxID=3218 RepID=A0A2K1IC23_PHYPA|nr:hypothetical protein PHYPA_030319 [Physcomitrium patens]
MKTSLAPVSDPMYFVLISSSLFIPQKRLSHGKSGHHQSDGIFNNLSSPSLVICKF